MIWGIFDRPDSKLANRVQGAICWGSFLYVAGHIALAWWRGKL